MTELVALTGLVIVGVVAIVGMAIGKGIELEFLGLRFQASKAFAKSEIDEQDPKKFSERPERIDGLVDSRSSSDAIVE